MQWRSIIFPLTTTAPFPDFKIPLYHKLYLLACEYRLRCNGGGR